MNETFFDAGSEYVESQVRDVVVVGRGAGDATTGVALTRARRSVLFLEGGKFLRQEGTVVSGEPLSWNGDVDLAPRRG